MVYDSGEPLWKPPPPRHQQAKQWRLATGDDIEEALTAAEHIWGQALDDQRHVQNLQLALGSTGIVALGSLVGLGIALYLSQYRFHLATATIVVIILIGASAIGSFMLRQLIIYRRRTRYGISRLLASDLASMIEETYLEVSERERWSRFRLEATKRRLAAFPLGESAKPPRDTY